jgi:hypothetical protein
MLMAIQKVIKIVLAGTVLVIAPMPIPGQTPTYRAPRADGGKPDLNGI